MTAIRLDKRLSLIEAPNSGHNRWHPDIPPIARVAPGDVLVVDTRDGIDNQIKMSSGPADVRSLEMRRGHPLTGPFFIDGAEPGDQLVVETLAIEPDDFGFTVVRPGAGPLGDLIDEPLVVRWTIRDGVARSPDLPGIAVEGAPFMGVMGVAPSHARLREFSARESQLERNGGTVMLPDPHDAVPIDSTAAIKGLRTVPPRETGGNIDVRQAGVGSRVILSVDVPGALFSLGDAHFAQGDGEVCSQAIEMQATVQVRFRLRKRDAVRWRPTNPVIEYVEPKLDHPRPYLITTGLPLDDEGHNHDLDFRLASRRALLEMTRYLMSERGFSLPQAYAICSVAVDLRVSEMVNIPNVLMAACLPLDIFEQQLTERQP